ncbi:site-specific DNA-methyltransferase [Arsenophonus nasoniae]|uniref:Methyltransferase n=1 Tax=Arsenophonus nasoniae TaxID=638 RepID=D2U1E5_9GAMM|nr:site-specific DNA-methyltransferase [Arsenophonus nasoniae]QBY44724.1 Modification methylase DpnIIB [Arsenophonus nasoniae]WGM04949.1 site-specific DNA-methyltransferase [Arsenophonus nasoniae]WGM10049.1 site-specific DNA-methyltransferase [Arsenophonus nasoniae]WGM14764.1 site-specific DNA-methyltransferase [Arsenophonus nasoniae]CBA74551.1 phage DNA methyltransferase [Arsenophonus nasoniae]
MTFSNQPILVNGDALPYVKTLPDDSIDLILTDPPYYRVKSCSWDRQWKTTEQYLAWLDDYLVEFQRILKPNGSLYLFCSSTLAADTEIMLRNHMKVLNHIIWAKPYGRWTGCSKESLRAFFPSTERILFAEQYGVEDTAKSEVFAPLIDYFINAKNQLNITGKEIEQYMGSYMHRHWFSYSQWQLPNETQYERLQQFFSQKAAEKRLVPSFSKSYNELQRDYGELTKSYGDLKRQYENLRRPFSVTKDVPYTDVWNFPPVLYYPGKHPCEKPAALLEHIINASSKSGHTVADFFMGSGSTVKAAIKLGRQAIGVELETDRFMQTKKEIENLSQSLHQLKGSIYEEG